MKHPPSDSINLLRRPVESAADSGLLPIAYFKHCKITDDPAACSVELPAELTKSRNQIKLFFSLFCLSYMAFIALLLGMLWSIRIL
jgi:hypothetical protein